MPRLRFRPAQAQAKAPTISPAKQAQGTAAPNVMQWLQYEIAPTEAIEKLGQVIGKGADMAFDAYIDDLGRQDRERRQEEADITDALAGQIKRFAQSERVKLYKDIKNRKISTEQFETNITQRLKDKRDALLKSDLVKAYLEDNPARKKPFMRRLTVQLEDAGHSDTTQTILEKLTTAEEQQKRIYEETLREARLEFAQKASDAGLLYKEEYTPETSRSEISEELDSIQADIINNYNNILPEEYHRELASDLRRLFINKSGGLEAWQVHKTLEERGKKESRKVVLAKRQARLALAEYANENELAQKLTSASPEEADEANEALLTQIGLIVTNVMEDPEFRSVLDDLHKDEITTDLNSIFQGEDYKTRAAAIDRLLQEADEQERKQEQLKLKDQRTRLGQADVDFGDSVRGIIEQYNAEEISLEEAESSIEAAAESARQKNQIEPTPNATELSDEDKQFNKELKVHADTLRSSLQTRLSSIEGTRKAQQTKFTKNELERMREKKEIDDISRAATKYRERLIDFNMEMQKNSGNKTYDLEYIQQEQLRILDEVLTDEFGIPGDRHGASAERVALKTRAFDALKKIQVSQEAQLRHAITADSIKLEAGTHMQRYMEEVTEERDRLEEEVKNGNISNPTEAASAFETFVEEKKKHYLQEAKDGPLPAVALDFETAAEFRSKIPAMISGFAQKMLVRNEGNIKDMDAARVQKIIDLTEDLGELESLSPSYRTFKDEEDVVRGESEGDPRIMAVASIYASKMGSIYSQGDVANLIQKAAIQIDHNDMNRLLMGDEASLRKGIQVLAKRGTEGAGAPAIIGGPRRVLLGQFKTALKQYKENDRAGIQQRIRNHHDRTIHGAPSRDSGTLEKLFNAGLFDDDPKINERIYKKHKYQQKYNETLHGLIKGTTSKLDESYEPELPLIHKSNASLNKLAADLDPTVWVDKNKPEDFDVNDADLQELRISHNELGRQISIIQQERELDRSAPASRRFLETAAGQNIPVPNTQEERALAKTFPELWNQQTFSSKRIKYVVGEQRRINPHKTPEFFSKNEIDNINNSFLNTQDSGVMRANLMAMIEQQSGPDFDDVIAELDKKTDIKSENQLYLDFMGSRTITENLHSALTATQAELYKGFEEGGKENFNALITTDPEIGAFTAAFALDLPTQHKMGSAVSKYALTLMHSDPRREMGEDEAIQQAKNDLIHSKYTIVPTDFGAAHFLQEKEKTNTLLHARPDMIQQGLKKLTDKVKFFDASQRAYEAEHTYFISTGEGVQLFMMSEGKATPAVDKSGKIVTFTDKDINLAGLEALLAKERAGMEAVSGYVPVDEEKLAPIKAQIKLYQ